MNQTDLLKINVNDHTEKKNGLTYLSWAWAWAEVLKVDPAATYKVEMYANAAGSVVPYMDLGNSCMVWVTVTIFGKPMTCQLPILDFRNKPIASPNAFDVNTSIMRCLAKGIALHGLGLYIYAGEDLPETDPAKETSTMGELTKKEDAPAYNKIAAKKEQKLRPQPTEWDNSDASRKLFAEGMVKYASLCTTVDDLGNYWMNNQLQLESLKETHMDLYKSVVAQFTTMKKNLVEGNANV